MRSLIFSQFLLPEGEGGRRPDEGATAVIQSCVFPLTLALSLRERGYFDALDEDER